MKPNLILDVDGVMTTGQFLYSADGKVYKIFGAHDADGLKVLKDKMNIEFISADKRGFAISKKRIDDMGYKITLVAEMDRYQYIKENYGFENTFYIGDGIFDAPILRDCKFGIAPKNARIEARRFADYVTTSSSGEGAVCDACIKINNLFFGGRK
ncbi:MAG: HAD hydrolase family protein [Nitrosarchaeum sp.]